LYAFIAVALSCSRAIDRPIAVNTKKLILQYYLRNLFRLRLLFKDFYLLEGLLSAFGKSHQYTGPHRIW